MEGAVLAAKPAIKVAAVCGSLRKASFHCGLIRSAIQLCNESINGIQIEYVAIDHLPFLNTDLEVNGTYPPPVEAFRRKILEADSILFASPEYNYSISSPLKNAIDWASRPPNVWADKPAAIVSAGGDFGGGRAQYHLRQVGVFLDLHFINKPELFVHAFQAPKKFDSDGNLIDPETKERLKQVLLSLQAFTYRLQDTEPPAQRLPNKDCHETTHRQPTVSSPRLQPASTTNCTQMDHCQKGGKGRLHATNSAKNLEEETKFTP